MAFRNGFEQGDPALLEPYMSVEILVPEEFLGEVLGDVNMRKGRIENITARKAIQVISCRRAALEDVRLLHLPSIVNPGAGNLHDAFFALRSCFTTRKPCRLKAISLDLSRISCYSLIFSGSGVAMPWPNYFIAPGTGVVLKGR